jgi:arginyl-tRNA synthetase
LTRPEEQFGDYATNIALQLAKQLGKNPREVAEALTVKIRENLSDKVADVSVAGPGFINLKLSDQALAKALKAQPAKQHKNQEILVEFGDPNPFKEMHLGHLYTAIAGDALARLFDASGARVQRLSYHGDVGMHVAKAVWGMRQLQDNRDNDGKDIRSVPSAERASFLSIAYAAGAQKYDEDEVIKAEVQAINEHIYNRKDPDLNRLYDMGKQWSFDYFDMIFDELDIKYQKRYLESDSSVIGVKFVKANIGKVFEQSDGAVVYRGEKTGLHTRVFITSKGLPTYETKDLGLAELKNQDFPKAAQSIVITAHEQIEYFRVMLAALAEIDPELAGKTKHIAHGFLSLTTGKMSSRRGQVYAAADLLKTVSESIRRQYPQTSSRTHQDVYLAAVRYTFLKNRIAGDIVFNVEESVSLEGNSGPYLQYAHARARSILRKAEGSDKQGSNADFEPGERSLARKISEYAEVVDKAVQELMPHHICTYLYELAQIFNRFYENSRVIGDERQATRLALVNKYADTLKNGLGLLGIASPDKM